MTGVLLANTAIAKSPLSPPVGLQKAIAAYLETHRQLQLQVLPAPGDLTMADWGALWQDYSRLLATEQPVAIATSTSFGDNWDANTTVADWCRDWRMSAILTLPADDSAVGLATAFAALASQSKATLVGFVLWQEGSGEALEAEAISQLCRQIETLARTPVLGLIAAKDLTDTESLVIAASQLNWELLPW